MRIRLVLQDDTAPAPLKFEHDGVMPIPLPGEEVYAEYLDDCQAPRVTCYRVTDRRILYKDRDGEPECLVSLSVRALASWQAS